MQNNKNSDFLKKSKIKISLYFTLISVLILLIIDVSIFAIRDFRQSNFYTPKHLIKNNFWKTSRIKQQNTKILIEKKKIFNEKRVYYRNKLIEDFWSTIPFIFLFWLLLFFLTFKLVSVNLKKIEENYEEMENFIHNAWHELKTPLAVISSNLQLDLKMLEKWKKLNLKESLEENLLEINNANNLINWLFSLAQISKEKNLEEKNLKNLIEKIISENEKKISEKNIFLEKNLENFNFKISENHFYILFSNIFFNAIRYSEKNWNIKIFLKKWILEISDNWIWISKENLDKIFDRFYQEWASRESEKWFWIWLSLVKKISEVYGLKIFVESVKNIWTKFIVKF